MLLVGRLGWQNRELAWGWKRSRQANDIRGKGPTFELIFGPPNLIILWEVRIPLTSHRPRICGADMLPLQLLLAPK